MSRVASALPPSGDVAFSSGVDATGLPPGSERIERPSANHGEVAFVPGAFLAPAAAGAGTAATAGGSAAALPALAAIAAGVLVVSAGVWAMAPESQRAQLSKWAVAQAKGILSRVPGLSEQEVSAHLKAIDRAFHQGIGAVKALATSWLQGSAPTSPQAPTRTAIVPTGGRLGMPGATNGASGSNRPQGPEGPRQTTAIAPPRQSSAPQLSAADRQMLQKLHDQAAALQAQAPAGRVLSPAQLASGSLIRQLQQLENGVEALLHRPGAADLRAGLTSLKAEARQHVAGLYRLTVNKAVAGLLTAQTPAGQQTRAQAGIITPYTPQALKQLQEQARPLLNAAADAPLLAKLKQRLANEAATAPRPGAADPSLHASPGSSVLVPPGERSTVTHTGRDLGGMAAGGAAGAIAQREMEARAEKAAQAADWVNQQINDPFNMSSPEKLAQDAATKFGVTSDEVMSALAAAGWGPEGALQGGVQASTTKHKRELERLILKAGLEIVEPPSETRGNHIRTVVKNKFGHTKLCFFPATPSDVRWTKNAESLLKGFARQESAGGSR